MTERIHDDEFDTGEAVVRTLLGGVRASWAAAVLEPLRTSGTDNATWRVRVADTYDVVVRLPRTAAAAAKVGGEVRLLEEIAAAGLPARISTPAVVYAGEPHEVFPHPWSVLRWLDGDDAWTARAQLGDQNGLAIDLADVVLAIRSIRGATVPNRTPGERGGPIGPLLRGLDWWLDEPRWSASEVIDVDRIRALAVEALDVPGPSAECFVHGDLIPGNLLVRHGVLSAVIDWGSAGIGDPAQDLAPAWAVLEEPARDRFRRAVGADDAEWIRARANELQHAVAAVLYYVPRGHPLGDVMSRTLERILAAVATT